MEKFSSWEDYMDAMDKEGRSVLDPENGADEDFHVVVGGDVEIGGSSHLCAYYIAPFGGNVEIYTDIEFDKFVKMLDKKGLCEPEYIIVHNWEDEYDETNKRFYDLRTAQLEAHDMNDIYEGNNDDDRVFILKVAYGIVLEEFHME